MCYFLLCCCLRSRSKTLTRFKTLFANCCFFTLHLEQFLFLATKFRKTCDFIKLLMPFPLSACLNLSNSFWCSSQFLLPFGLVVLLLIVKYPLKLILSPWSSFCLATSRKASNTFLVVSVLFILLFLFVSLVICVIPII